MYRCFSTAFRRYIVSGAAGTQDVQDAVEQTTGFTSGSADVWLRWREVVPGNYTEIIIDFLESHIPEYYLVGLIYLEQPHQLFLEVLPSSLSGIDRTAGQRSNRFIPLFKYCSSMIVM